MSESEAPNALNALKRARDGWQEEAASLARRLRLAEADNDLLRKHQSNDVWYFQGDGEDHLESMGANMVVVIHASDLRAFLASRVIDEAAACRNELNALGDDEGQGLDSFWKGAFREGWNARAKLATTASYCVTPQSAVVSFVPCTCHDETARKYCAKSRVCSRIEAQSTGGST